MKESPYSLFKKWLFSDNGNELDITVRKAITPYIVLSMFFKCRPINIFLNDNYNNYKFLNAVYGNEMEFYDFLKQLVKKHNIRYTDIGYLKTSKKKDEYKEYLMDLFPFLKTYELNLLYDTLKDKEDFKYLIETIDDKKIKTRKAKKVKKSQGKR